MLTARKFMAEGLLRTMIKKMDRLLSHSPDNYEARANLMWAGTHAINGVVGDGCSPAWYKAYILWSMS